MTMHELSICQNIIRIVSQQTPTDKKIKSIWLEIGELAGIEKDALLFSFPIAAQYSPAANAQLEIIDITGLAQCSNCNRSMPIQQRFTPCQYCGTFGLTILQGEELRVQKMELIQQLPLVTTS